MGIQSCKGATHLGYRVGEHLRRHHAVAPDVCRRLGGEVRDPDLDNVSVAVRSGHHRAVDPNFCVGRFLECVYHVRGGEGAERVD